MSPPYFNQTYSSEADVEFQDVSYGGYLGYQNGLISAILNFHAAPILPSSFRSIRLTVWKRIIMEDFQAGLHDSLHVDTILMESKALGDLTTENLQDGCIVDILTIFFNDSEFPCHPNASHQVLAQSDLPVRSRGG